MKIRVGVVIAALTLSFFAPLAHAAIPSVGDPGQSWSLPNDGNLGQHIMQFLDTPPGGNSSYLVDTGREQNTSLDPTCKSATDTKCNLNQLYFQTQLPQCSNSTEFNCIEDFGLVDANGQKTSAKFARYFPAIAQNQFTGDPSKNIPNGSTASLYSLPEALHDGGDKYFVAATVKGQGSAISNTISLSSFSVRVYPVKLDPVTNPCIGKCYEAGYAVVWQNPDGSDRWGHQGPGYSNGQFCIDQAVLEKLCAQRYAFPAEKTFFTSVRLKQQPTGWMHGRLTDPNISISQKNGYSLITIEGKPIAVPAVYKKYEYTEMPAELKSLYSVEKGGYAKDFACSTPSTTYCAGGRSGPSPDPLKRNVIIAPEPSSANGMEQLKYWLPYVGDKASALLSSWTARTLSPDETVGANSCFANPNQVTGIVTTNSTQYSAGPPSFDKANGTLNYQVASPHFGSKGDVFKGTYDLVMRSEVARCIYGFSKAPISATISVISADGTSQIATTVVGEKDGWVYLKAANFEFSAPTIKVQLTQEAPAPVAIPKAASKKITCMKGKISKVVSTSNCPVGYKKK